MIYLLIACIIAFLVTYFATPFFKKFAESIGLVGIDQMKLDKPEYAEFGSPPVIFGFIFGVFSFAAMVGSLRLSFMAAVTSLIITAMIGMLDELTVLRKRQVEEGFLKREGIPQWLHPFIFVIGALPLMALKVGCSTITLPFIGSVNVGILYSLILVPLGVTGAANATNMLAGFNGLQAGLGIIMMVFLGSYAYIHGSFEAAVIAFIFASCLLAFLRYNWYPAKIMPGSLDYLVGAAIAIVAIVGNIEKFALICFVPWFIEFVLKARSRFNAENFGKIQPDGTLKAPYDKNYSVLHLVMHLGRFKEYEVTAITLSIVTIWCGISWIICEVI